MKLIFVIAVQKNATFDNLIYIQYFTVRPVSIIKKTIEHQDVKKFKLWCCLDLQIAPFFSNSEGQLENVHFNLHFIPDSSTRIFSQEIKEILVNSLNSTKAIPEVELKSLTVTERKPLEQTRRRKVQKFK